MVTGRCRKSHAVSFPFPERYNGRYRWPACILLCKQMASARDVKIPVGDGAGQAYILRNEKISHASSSLARPIT